MNSFTKKILLSMGAVGTVILPTMAIVSCGSDKKSTHDDKSTEQTKEQLKKSAEQLEKFKDLVHGFDLKAPESFGHFSLPDDFPNAPKNAHFEFNNNELYNFEFAANGEATDYWTNDISNFIMTPYFTKDKTVFKVKLVANKGYNLSNEAEFDLSFSVKPLVWDNADINKMIGNNIFAVPDGKGNYKHFSTIEKAVATVDTKGKNPFPSTDKKLTLLLNTGPNNYLNYNDFKEKLDTKNGNHKVFETIGSNKISGGSFLKTSDGKDYSYYSKMPTNETSHWGTLSLGGISESKVFEKGKTYKITAHIGGFNVESSLLLKTDGDKIIVKPLNPSDIVGDSSEKILKDGDDNDVTLSGLVQNSISPEELFTGNHNYTSKAVSGYLGMHLPEKYLFMYIEKISDDLSAYDNPDVNAKAIGEKLSFHSEGGINVFGDDLDTPGFFENAPKNKSDVPFEITENNFTNVTELFAHYNNEDTSFKFHKYNKSIDIAHDFGFQPFELRRPININEILELDGKNIKAIVSKPKSEPSPVEEADDIYN